MTRLYLMKICVCRFTFYTNTPPFAWRRTSCCRPSPTASDSPSPLKTGLWWLIICFDRSLFHLRDISRSVIVRHIHRARHLLQTKRCQPVPGVSHKHTGCLHLRPRWCVEFKLHQAILKMHHVQKGKTMVGKRIWKWHEWSSPVDWKKIKFTMQNQFLKLLGWHSNQMHLLDTWEEKW